MIGLKTVPIFGTVSQPVGNVQLLVNGDQVKDVSKPLAVTWLGVMPEPADVPVVPRNSAVHELAHEAYLALIPSVKQLPSALAVVKRLKIANISTNALCVHVAERSISDPGAWIALVVDDQVPDVPPGPFSRIGPIPAIVKFSNVGKLTTPHPVTQQWQPPGDRLSAPTSKTP